MTVKLLDTNGVENRGTPAEVAFPEPAIRNDKEQGMIFAPLYLTDLFDQLLPKIGTDVVPSWLI